MRRKKRKIWLNTALAVACFGFRIAIVRADAAYFTYALLNYIRVVLHAGFMIDYNLRRKGKTALATLPFIRQWRFHARFRMVIERHFAWAKRYTNPFQKNRL